jgi:hypothetical protein
MGVSFGVFAVAAGVQLPSHLHLPYTAIAAIPLCVFLHPPTLFSPSPPPPEYKAWKIYRSIDVDYVFVVFGGMVGYSSDDINKFLWMVRIGGGVYPEIKEADYLSSEGK